MTEDEIKLVARAAKITDYLSGRGVILSRSGRRAKCCCPLPGHKDDTPSFYIGTKADGTEVFKCYGCNSYGDVISLVQKMEGVGFMEAMRRLAFKVGIKLTDGKGEPAIHVEMPEREVLLNLCPEDNDGIKLSRVLWHFLEAQEFSDNAVDKVSKAYAAYDKLVTQNDADGIRKLSDNVHQAYLSDVSDFPRSNK